MAHTDGGRPRTENECRDRTVVLLRGYLAPFSIYPADEADMPQGKRADIVFQYEALLLPVEAKRQQHPGLWTAIDAQLEARLKVSGLFPRDPVSYQGPSRMGAGHGRQIVSRPPEEPENRVSNRYDSA